MNHHPDHLLRIALDIHRSKIDAAERARLARGIQDPRRPRFTRRDALADRHGPVPRRQRELVLQGGR